MPLQNRVDPYGKIQANRSRGSFMGNRGVLHNEQQEIVRDWRLKRWITCALEHGSIKRDLMAPGAYTELFFLDEPTSYAAGHRPCAACRNTHFKAFKDAWAKSFPEATSTIESIDQILHTARLLDNGGQRTWFSRLSELPNGTLISHLGCIFLLWDNKQWAWSYSGYELTAEPIRNDQEVTVLTPKPIVCLFASGLSKSLQVHPTAHGICHTQDLHVKNLGSGG